MQGRGGGWLLFALLVLFGACRWMVVGAYPAAESTLSSLMMGCGWAALLSLMLLVRGPAQATVRKSWLGLLSGALLFAGPAVGVLIHAHELDATALTMALALTPVAVGIAAAALGAGSLDGAAGRIWPGLAAAGGLLLLLAEPNLNNPRSDAALILAPGHGFAASSVNYGPADKEAYSAGYLRTACPIVGSFGAKDHTLRGAAARLERILTEVGVDHDVKEYRNAGHGFLNDRVAAGHHSPALFAVFGPILNNRYEPESADDARRRILDFFGKHLTQGPTSGEPQGAA